MKSITGKHPTKLGTLASRISRKEIVATIIDKFKNYSSIISIKILNCFSKIYERFLHNQIVYFSNEFLSDFTSAYRKGYSTNHVFVRLIENWKISLDKNLFTGAVLMDLSKTFDCIPHDLLIAKLLTYGLSFELVTFLNLNLKDRQQNVRINNIFSVFQNILSGVSQGSILGQILFNIFLNDLFLFIKGSEFFR